MRWLDGITFNGHEFEQTLGDGGGQGSLACCSPWGHKESEMIYRLNNIPRSEIGDHMVVLLLFYFFFTLNISLLLFFYFTILYWFCHTSTCIHHGCTRVPHPEPSSHLQSFPASGSYQMSQLFASGGQRTGVSVSISVLK